MLHPDLVRSDPPAVLIIGYGSPIRGDDALGPLAADRLSTLDLPSWIEVQSRHILTAELVEDLARVSRVIFIDAAADAPAGEILQRQLFPDPSAPSTMAHFHDPRELLAWCQTLHGHYPESWLISAGGDCWDYANYQLSPAASLALDTVIELTLKLLAD